MLLRLCINSKANRCMQTWPCRRPGRRSIVAEKLMKSFEWRHNKWPYSGEREREKRKRSTFACLCEALWNVCVCVSVQGCVHLHCGGPGQNVNAGRQPPLHDGPGSEDRAAGSRGGETEGTEEGEEALKTTKETVINSSLWHFAGNDC